MVFFLFFLDVPINPMSHKVSFYDDITSLLDHNYFIRVKFIAKGKSHIRSKLISLIFRLFLIFRKETRVSCITCYCSSVKETLLRSISTRA